MRTVGSVETLSSPLAIPTVIVQGDTVVVDPAPLSDTFVAETRQEILSARFGNVWANRWEHLADMGVMVGGGIAGGLLLTLLFVPICGAAAPLCAGGVLAAGGGGYWVYHSLDNSLRARQWMQIGQEIGSIPTVEQGAELWAEGLLGDAKGAVVIVGTLGAVRVAGPRLARWWQGRGVAEPSVEVLQRRPAAFVAESSTQPRVIDLTEVGGRWVYAGGGQVVEVPPPFPTLGEWGYARPVLAVRPEGWAVAVPEWIPPPSSVAAEAMLWAGVGGGTVRVTRQNHPSGAWMAAPSTASASSLAIDPFEVAFDKITSSEGRNPVRSEALRFYLPQDRAAILEDARRRSAAIRNVVANGHPDADVSAAKPEAAVHKALEDWATRKGVDLVYAKYVRMMEEQNIPRNRWIPRERFGQLSNMHGAIPLRNFLEVDRQGLKPGMIARGTRPLGGEETYRIQTITPQGKIKASGIASVVSPNSLFTGNPKELRLPDGWEEEAFRQALRSLLGTKPPLSKAEQKELVDRAMCLAADVYHGHEEFSGERTPRAFLQAVLRERPSSR